MASRPRTTGAASSHGKNHNNRSSSSGSSSKAAAGAMVVEPPETYEERQRRYNAARVLESNEMLIWWSMVRNESLPQTRLHFENQLAGFASDDSEPEWDDDPTGGPPAAGAPGVAVRFLFGENRRAAESSYAATRERAYANAGVGVGVGPAGMDMDMGVPDMVPLAGEMRVGSGSWSGSSTSGGNSPAGKGAGGAKKGRRSVGGGGGSGGDEEALA